MTYRKKYDPIEEVKTDIFIYIELFYNRKPTGTATLWYCAGEVYSAQDGSVLTFDWSDGDYDPDNDTGRRLMTVDLEYEDTWEGFINNFLLAVCSTGYLDKQTADIMWIGFFRTEKDAYNYAGMGEYYAKENGEEATVTETETVTDTETLPYESDIENAETTTNGVKDTQKPAESTTQTGAKGGANIGLIIGVIAGVTAVTAVVAAIVIQSKKKK